MSAAQPGVPPRMRAVEEAVSGPLRERTRCAGEQRTRLRLRGILFLIKAKGLANRDSYHPHACHTTADERDA
jgi:hypothetical protein